MRRKLLSVTLCVCMMFTMVPFAFAEGTDTGSNAEGTDTTIPADTDTDTTGGSGSSNDSSSSSPTSPVEVSTADALQDALSAAKDGTIIKLTDNITVTARAVFSGQNMTVTLDLNNHTLTGPDNGYALDNSNNNKATTGKLIVKDGTIQRADNVKGSNSTVRNYGEMELNNVQVNGNYIVVKNEETATLSMNSCTLTAPDTYVDKDNQTLIPSGLLNWGTATATDSTITAGDAVFVSSYINNDSTTTLTNCTVVGTSDAIYSGRFDTSSASQTVIINGGKYTGDVYSGAGSVININTTVSGNLSVVNNFECVLGSAQYISSGPSKTTIGENGSISGTIKAAAKNGNTYYSTITNAIEAASTNATIDLVQDTIEDVTVPAGKTVTLNLNGKKLTNVSSDTITVANGAKLTITGEGTVDNVTHGKADIYNNGTVILNGGNYTRSQEAANTTETSGGNSYYNILNHGDMTIDGAVEVLSTGHFSSLVANGYYNYGSTNPRDGYVNGTNQASPKLTINNGSFSGGINTIKNDDNATLEIKAGTFTNYTQSAFQNHHIATIEGGTFDGANVWAVLNCGAANCPVSDTDKHETTITGGYFNGNFEKTAGSITISGGYFTTDPTAYLATGKAAVESDLAGYNYKVANKSNAPATVASAEPTVDTDGLSADQLEVATEIATKLDSNTVTGDGLTAAASTIANNNTVSTDDGKRALESKQITTGTDNTRIVVQTYMDIDITAVNTTSKTLTLDITPMYRTVATTANADSEIRLTGADVTDANAVLVGPAGKLIINKPVTIKIPLPTNFVSPAITGANDYPSIYVQHKGYEYTATVSKESEESDTLYATFTNPHGFSTFTITTEKTAEATLNGVNYTSFQDAVNAANNGDVITALKDNLSATMSGSPRTITVKSSTGTFNVSVNGETKTADANTGVTFTYTRPSSGGPGSSGGSISTPTTYAVNVNAATNGAVAADKKTASKGTTVTVTASPSKGYVVDAVKVVDKDGKDVAVTGKDGKYVFTMPGSAVTVTGTFKAETPAPVALPFTDVKSGNWFYDAVKYAYEQGLMTGTSATTFAPNGTMNRAMIVTVLYRLEKSPAVTGASKFTDVPAGQWYSDAVAWAAANKIVNGYDETTFGPMNAVTREQMAAILFRYEQVKGLENVTLEENLNRFPDQNKISAYAIPALQWAVGQKIINGNADGTLDPTGTATRAQVAQIFTNLLNK